MSFNLFDWLRSNVRDSVLLGVSDAVHTMGMPPDETSKDKILGFLKSDADNEAPVRRMTGGTSSSGTRKLGRSLTEIAAKEVP
jgi:hypothetical protein